MRRVCAQSESRQCPLTVKFYLGTLGLRFSAWPSIEICFENGLFLLWRHSSDRWSSILECCIDYQRLPVRYGCRLSAVGYRETLHERDKSPFETAFRRSSITNRCCHDPEITWGFARWWLHLTTIIFYVYQKIGTSSIRGRLPNLLLSHQKTTIRFPCFHPLTSNCLLPRSLNLCHSLIQHTQSVLHLKPFTSTLPRAHCSGASSTCVWPVSNSPDRPRLCWPKKTNVYARGPPESVDI